ncbi:MAG: hypothetical protein LBC68_10835 [Prevotellaceae bacterium]|jgi:hypothetical protein|nr:hypothetical protein [Prevotellaceae bacterium]
MKKIIFILVSCLLATSMLTVSCGSDNNNPAPDPNLPVPDPEGTISLSFYYGNSEHSLLPNGTVYMYNGRFNTINSLGRFISVGQVAGLGNITKIPENGQWVDYISIFEGCGYILQAGGLYCRIYVESVTVNSAGNVNTALIKYQSPFNP